jgi:hypothetical protein
LQTANGFSEQKKRKKLVFSRYFANFPSSLQKNPFPEKTVLFIADSNNGYPDPDGKTS